MIKLFMHEDTYMQNPYCLLGLDFPFFCKRYILLFSRWVAWSHTWRRYHPFAFSDITSGLIRKSLINLDLAPVSIGCQKGRQNINIFFQLHIWRRYVRSSAGHISKHASPWPSFWRADPASFFHGTGSLVWNPETLFCIDFMLKKPCLKFPNPAI